MNGYQIIKTNECNEEFSRRDDAVQVLLKVKHPHVELIEFDFSKDTFGNFGISDDPDVVEIYVILSGNLVLTYGDDISHDLHEGDMFTLVSGDEMLTFEASSGTKMLMYTNKSDYLEQEECVKKANLILDQLTSWDGYTGSHCSRVARYALEMARLLHYPSSKSYIIRTASNYHDIGKLYISKEILCKPDKLTPEEYETIKKHCQYSADILRPLFGDDVADLVLTHHEWLNGHGYPKGLSGDAIAMESRIIAVADAYDAMTSNRNYNVVRSSDEALAELRRCENTQFDPICVDALEKYLSHCKEKKH